MSAKEARIEVRDLYRTILGRNRYNQARRSYVYQKYSNGLYYSDCSSSIAATYRKCGYPINYNGSALPNTVGMYHSKDLSEVPVTIRSGVIQNPEALRIGDLLLFAGDDSSRAKAGYVGHVEMVGEISGDGKITIYGHGSGVPRATELNGYCKQRYAKKSSTKLGNKGLIRVLRRIPDDEPEIVDEAPEFGILPVTGPCVQISGCRSAHLRTGPGTEYGSVGICKSGDIFSAPETAGWAPVIHGGMVCWVSERYARRVTEVGAE